MADPMATLCTLELACPGMSMHDVWCEAMSWGAVCVS